MKCHVARFTLDGASPLAVVRYGVARNRAYTDRARPSHVALPIIPTRR
jgi:hypothetical protein